MTDATIEDAIRLSRSIAGVLRGHTPETQGAVLVDVVATWIAGHIVPGDPAATDRMREWLLREHAEVVRKLIPITSAQIHGTDTDEK